MIERDTQLRSLPSKTDHQLHPPVHHVVAYSLSSILRSLSNRLRSILKPTSHRLKSITHSLRTRRSYTNPISITVTISYSEQTLTVDRLPNSATSSSNYAAGGFGEASGQVSELEEGQYVVKDNGDGWSVQWK